MKSYRPFIQLALILLLQVRDINSSTDVRLVSASDPNEGTPDSGRLEVFLDGQWGTVCSRGFGKTEGQVACTQLGLNGTSPIYTTLSKTDLPRPPSTTPIWLVDLNCDDTSTDLLTCANGEENNSCTHEQDVILTCSERKKIHLGERAILGIVLAVIFVVFLCTICLVALCTVPSELKRRAKLRSTVDEDGKPSASAPLLEDTDDPSAPPMIPLQPLKPPPPPTNPSYVLPPTGQSKPVIHEGVPYVPPISLPEGPTPPPLMTYYAPQEPNTTAGYAPDAPKTVALPPSQPSSVVSQYPPQSAYTAAATVRPISSTPPVPVSDPVANRSTSPALGDMPTAKDQGSSQEDPSEEARKAIPALQKQSEMTSNEGPRGQESSQPSGSEGAASERLYPSLDTSDTN